MFVNNKWINNENYKTKYSKIDKNLDTMFFKNIYCYEWSVNEFILVWCVPRKKNVKLTHDNALKFFVFFIYVSIDHSELNIYHLRKDPKSKIKGDSSIHYEDL